MASTHIVSWNVAGWKATVEHIQRFKGGFASFLERHHVDVLCVQEVKLSSKAVEAEPFQLGADVSGFDSFWACNDGAGAQRQGLNGVATFARAGTVLRANREPLGDPELDKEGRCLMTDHGAYVLFNAYVPHSAGPRFPLKIRFLHALRAAMQREQSKGRAVVLAGDLNMKARAKDTSWGNRMLEVPRLEASISDAASEEARAAAKTITETWPSVVDALRLKEVQMVETNRHGQAFQRWGVFASAASGDVVRLGPPHESEECAQAAFEVEGTGLDQNGDFVFGAASADATYVLCRPGAMPARQLAECMRRLAGADLDGDALRELSLVAGGPPLAPPEKDWFDAVLGEDGMVDAFAEMHPDAKDRFTFWNQHRQLRQENIGARIDYILVCGGVFKQYAHRGCGFQAYCTHRPETPEAAMCASTLGGRSALEAALFDGGGLPPLEVEEYDAQFRAAPGTGMLYTPPQLSDHIPVTVLLRGLPAQASAAPAARDAATTRCQPHKRTKRIMDFFQKKTAAQVADDTAPPPAKRAALGTA